MFPLMRHLAPSVFVVQVRDVVNMPWLLRDESTVLGSSICSSTLAVLANTSTRCISPD